MHLHNRGNSDALRTSSWELGLGFFYRSCLGRRPELLRMARLVSPKTQQQREGSRDRKRDVWSNSKVLTTLICLISLMARRSKLL